MIPPSSQKTSASRSLSPYYVDGTAGFREIRVESVMGQSNEVDGGGHDLRVKCSRGDRWKKDMRKGSRRKERKEERMKE